MHTDRLRYVLILVRGGIQPLPGGRAVVAHAEAIQRARVALLSAWGLSVGYHGSWNAIIAFWSAETDLSMKDRTRKGHASSSASH